DDHDGKSRRSGRRAMARGSPWTIFELIFELRSPISSLQLERTRPITSTAWTRTCTSAHCTKFAGRSDSNYTIFEGTSEIQRLVIARAISGRTFADRARRCRLAGRDADSEDDHRVHRAPCCSRDAKGRDRERAD